MLSRRRDRAHRSAQPSVPAVRPRRHPHARTRGRPRLGAAHLRGVRSPPHHPQRSAPRGGRVHGRSRGPSFVRFLRRSRLARAGSVDACAGRPDQGPREFAVTTVEVDEVRRLPAQCALNVRLARSLPGLRGDPRRNRHPDRPAARRSNPHRRRGGLVRSRRRN